MCLPSGLPKFDNTYASLPEHFYARQAPVPVAAPQLIKLNTELAVELGLDPAALSGPHGIEMLAGNFVPDGAASIALAYAGHQFGHFVPQLGDGRAILLGEIVSPAGKRYDIQLKGSGVTPFSRRGDGRAAMGPVLREYIVSEAMAALGIPTTRTLAAAATGEHVLRETVLPGAVLTRVASSHIRIGTFQYFAARGDIDAVRKLADYTIDRHYPEAAQSERPYLALFNAIVLRQATLIAEWMLAGFVHGVMNTDNTSIAGETIDYGPCAFIEAYNPETVFSSIDRQSRYAFGNKPHIARWNLARLAETLLPWLGEHQACRSYPAAEDALDAFEPQFQAAYHAGLGRKLGFSTIQPGDAALAEDLLARMAANRADYTLTFRRLCDAAADDTGDGNVRCLFAAPETYDVWAAQWRQRLAQETVLPADRARTMRTVNPLFIPRNHLVEAALSAAVTQNDFTPFTALLAAVSNPYKDNPDLGEVRRACLTR